MIDALQILLGAAAVIMATGVAVWLAGCARYMARGNVSARFTRTDR